MKKTILMLCVGCSCMFSNAPSASAQIGLSINIGAQPVWAPVGYDHADYYYIPDIDAYYDVSRRVYVYQQGPRWVTTVGLPPRYHNFDIYHAHKVVINDHNPWMHHDRDRVAYAKYRGMHDQTIIRDSHEPKYYENPGHPQHAQWHGGGRPQGHGPAGRGHDDRGHEDHGHRQDNHGGHEDHGHDEGRH